MLLASITKFAKKRGKNTKTGDTSRATGLGGYGFYHPVKDEEDKPTSGEGEGDGGDGGGE